MESESRHQSKTSLRYGGGAFDARTVLIRIFCFLQRKKAVILRSDPRRCGEILAASATKGTFIEHLFAIPAWHPIYSIESTDGPLWEQLSQDFKKLMGVIGWRERLTPLTRQHAGSLTGLVDAEAISRLVARILFELLFCKAISSDDETLFYQASLEWRKEIALKGKANVLVKSAFWNRLAELVADSPFKDGLDSYKADPACWLSLFAQPFLISPQINVSDIFVTVFHYLRANPASMEAAMGWAAQDDKARLGGVVLESIRLRHPFPILEREVADTQFFIVLDRFEQDQRFDPERWLQAPSENPYYSIPFAAGPRMCVGKPIAMELLVELLKVFLLDFSPEQIQPQRGHLYSGRDNDLRRYKGEFRYQAGVFLRGLWRSLILGQRGARTAPSTPPASGCPWKKMTERFQREQALTSPQATPETHGAPDSRCERRYSSPDG